MDTWQLLLQGFQGAITPVNLVVAGLGCLLGTTVGVLPGIGPATTVALLIPVAFGVSPDTALIMMTAVYLGAMYGGSLTSVLLNVPGEASSMMTAIDGFQMAKQGRAGPALAIAAIGSFIGGTLSVVALTLVAVPIGSVALLMGPAEYFSLMVAALLMTSVLLGTDLLKSTATMLIGLVIATVGMDLQGGIPRMTFGFGTLMDGIDAIVVLMGVFGVGEVLWFLAHRRSEEGVERLTLRGRVWLSWEDWKQSWWPVMRGSVVGFIAGVLPGSGGTLGSVMAYTVEQRVSKHPDRFGKGAIEGVAASETANNAATGGALIPMLTLGVPGSGTTAVLLVALMMYGILPGPRLMVEYPEVIWSVIASLYISNVILVILNLPLIPLFVRVLDIPVRFLMPVIIVVATVGAYSNSGSFTDVILLFLFGALGYVLRLLDVPQVALVLGVVLGARMERSLRQAILISNGDWSIFFARPISAAFLTLGIVLVIWDVVSKSRKRAAEGNRAEEAVANAVR
ncbi:MAG: tripartite tricarboxylate transporter permease [Chloroflexota bacterium]